jgi:hypothetical protein
MQEDKLLTAVHQLLEQTRLSPGEVTSRFEQAWSVDFWQRLNPSLSVCCHGAGGLSESRAIGPHRRKAILVQLANDGYFEVQSLLPRRALERMRRGIDVLRQHDWPPVFAFVYDEFWQVTRVPSLVRLLATVLGPGYRQIPHVWSFFVPAALGAAGWKPHVDRGGRSSWEKRLVLWIPLSDATLDNGCIYVIPRRRIAHRIERAWLETKSYTASELNAILQGSRALPARTGSVLGWDFNLIHWGSACGDGAGPRVSLSVEFIGPNTEPTRDECPLLEAAADRLPPFAQRLHVIGRAIRDYQRFEPRMVRFGELSDRLVESAWPTSC